MTQDKASSTAPVAAPRLAEQQQISHLTRNTLALVLAGGKGSRLSDLTEWRAKPALYFGGKFRLIDFPISNCVNSGIRQVGVITQYKAHSLIRHIQRAWSKLNHEFGEFVDVLPASQRVGGEWYRGTADAVFQNIDIIRSISPTYVLILSGDHVYKMDYGLMIATHVEKESDMTISCIEVPIEEAANAYGVLTVDEQGRVLKFTEKPEHPDPLPGSTSTCLASMGNYVFNTDFLYEQVISDSDHPKSTHDFGHDVIPRIIKNYRVFVHKFTDDKGEQAYWRDVGTIDSYWKANMELIDVVPELDMYDLDWRIMTYQEQLPPAKFVFDDDDRRGHAVSSMVSGGCVISGATVRRSLLFSNVIVNSWATVEDSVILPNVDIGRNCRLRRCIVDAGTQVPKDTVIGEDLDEDRRRGFHVTDTGIVLVTAQMLGQTIHWTR